MKYCHLEIDFNVSQGVASQIRYGHGVYSRILNLDPCVLFIKNRLISKSGIGTEEGVNASSFCFLYKVISSSDHSDDSSSDSHQETTTREKELTINKETKRNSHSREFLKDVFRFAEHQRNPKIVLGYEKKH